jgi:hypothetical protein
LGSHPLRQIMLISLLFFKVPQFAPWIDPQAMAAVCTCRAARRGY